MPALLFALFVNLTAIAVQTVVWRTHLAPRRLGVIYLIYLASFAGWSAASLVGVSWLPDGHIDLVRALLFGVTIMLVYLSTYSGVELDSASMVMLRHVEKHPGSTRDSFYSLLDDEMVVLWRLTDLERAGWVRREGEHYRVVGMGRLFIEAVRRARRLFTAEGIGG